MVCLAHMYFVPWPVSLLIVGAARDAVQHFSEMTRVHDHTLMATAMVDILCFIGQVSRNQHRIAEKKIHSTSRGKTGNG